MADLQIFGVIDTDLQDDVRAQLNQVKDKEEPLNVALASPGGFAHVGVTIYNWLTQYKTVNVDIQGDVMSAATVIMAAGDYVEMPNNAMLMIHSPYVYGISGDAAALKKAVQYLEQVANNVVKIYHAKTRIASGMLSRLMEAETYFDAQDALARGFVDNVTGNQAGMMHKTEDYKVHDTDKLAKMLAERPTGRVQSEYQAKLERLRNHDKATSNS